MKKAFIVFVLFLTLTFANNPKETRIYFSEDLTQPNPQCVAYFVNLVKTSNYEFGTYMENKNIQWTKQHISFEFDTWDSDRILVRLFFDWEGKNNKEFQGTGTITWLEYDIKTQTLKDNIQEKELVVKHNMANKFNECLKYCDFALTSTLQNQYKNSNVDFLMENEIVGEGRAFFYSYPNENCKIDNLFLIPKDKFNLLQSKGEFSFVAYRRKSGEIIKLWIKSNRIKKI